ncbi:MAG: SLC13 family permease [Promethearchaeota archaeon]
MVRLIYSRDILKNGVNIILDQALVNPALSIFIVACFIGLIVVLFFEKEDYLTYSILFVVLAVVATALSSPAIFEGSGGHIEPIDFFVGLINWEVIFFLISIFTIVEILNEKNFFQAIAKSIANKYKDNKRKMFYIFCIISILSASFIEDLSVALIFGPIILLSCRKLKIDPAPFLLGITISINLASTLTPFGSAENILIANHFRTKGITSLDMLWFLQNIGLYFLIATTITLVLLDFTILKPSLGKSWDGACKLKQSLKSRKLDAIEVDRKTMKKNVIGLAIFIFLLIAIPQIYLAGIVSMLIFIFLNPVRDADGKERIRISHYFRKIDYKIIYFFMCLFIFVGLLEFNGTISLIEGLFSALDTNNVFLISIIIMLVTSLLSGLMDNAPVTLIFLPIINSLFISMPTGGNAIIVGMIIGINVGGNFLPQGSACDMAILDIAQKNCVTNLSFKRLFEVGAKFALLHIVIGIGYIALIVFGFQ